MMAPSIRMICDLPQSAAFNMAADLNLLCAAADTSTVFLRFYTWEQPTITLGHTQVAAEVLDLEVMEKTGVSWIRRPTGGRAVLHKEDLTYSVIFGKQVKAMGSSITESYRIIADALLAGFKKAGIECMPHDTSLDTGLIKREKKLPCFLAPNRDEIMVAGRKLVGSAQKRTAHAVLQHGSIAMTTAFRELPRYCTISDDQRQTEQELFERKCTCIDECRPGLSIGAVVEALSQGFTEALGLPLIRQEWNADEHSEITARVESASFKSEYLS